MKKTLLAIIAIFFALPFISNAQTWSGLTPGNIYYNSGNVGIGTTSPVSGGFFASWLTLNGTSNYSGGVAYAISGAAKGFSYIDADGLLTQQSINSGQKFVVNTSTNAMTILSNGNVGIGTTSPDQLLTVNGTIYSKEVKVDLSVPGPDYVFKPDYKLTSLAELKTYVDKNHHLPEIPSAAEMAKNGIDLGDMNTKLLKKVEELTLYLIEKDKQVEEQKKVNQSQQTQLDLIKQQLNRLTAKN